MVIVMGALRPRPVRPVIVVMIVRLGGNRAYGPLPGVAMVAVLRVRVGAVGVLGVHGHFTTSYME